MSSSDICIAVDRDGRNVFTALVRGDDRTTQIRVKTGDSIEWHYQQPMPPKQGTCGDQEEDRIFEGTHNAPDDTQHDSETCGSDDDVEREATGMRSAESMNADITPPARGSALLSEAAMARINVAFPPFPENWTRTPVPTATRDHVELPDFPVEHSGVDKPESCMGMVPVARTVEESTDDGADPWRQRHTYKPWTYEEEHVVSGLHVAGISYTDAIKQNMLPGRTAGSMRAKVRYLKRTRRLRQLPDGTWWLDAQGD
jgi:hypothetical protein